MAEQHVAMALRAMGRDPHVDAQRLAGSASGSGVYRVRAGAAEAVLKVTMADGWREAARRELRCYRELTARLPVAMPRILDWADSDEVTAILLSAHQPAAPAPDWTYSEWLEVAEQLGALHKTEERTNTPHAHWLFDVLSHPRVAAASAYWRGTDAASLADTLLGAPAEFADVLARSPRCFTHGDCHVGNLLRGDDGSLVWADWQAVSIGPGEADLAFLWARAEIDAGEPPREAMLRRYAATRGVDVDVARRAVLAAELAIVLFAWPEYAGLNSQRARDRITRRMLRLAAEWDQS